MTYQKEKIGGFPNVNSDDHSSRVLLEVVSVLFSTIGNRSSILLFNLFLKRIM